jgi:hypothetical protein
MTTDAIIIPMIAMPKIGYFNLNAKTEKRIMLIVMNHPNIKVTIKYVFSKLVTSNYPDRCHSHNILYKNIASFHS